MYDVPFTLNAIGFPDESTYAASYAPAGRTVPVEPSSQFCAVGGLVTSKAFAFEFQITIPAPDQPWPVPKFARS